MWGLAPLRFARAGQYALQLSALAWFVASTTCGLPRGNRLSDAGVRLRNQAIRPTREFFHANSLLIELAVE
jgi:hypothetical protein